MKQDNLIYKLDHLNRVIRRGRPIRRGGYRLLRLIQETPMISSQECAQQLDIRVTSINERLSRLIDKGLVIREPFEDDKRKTGLMITQLGQDTLFSLQQEKKDFTEKIESILTQEEINNLGNLLDKLTEGLRR